MRKSRPKQLLIWFLALLGVSLTSKKWISKKNTRPAKSVLVGTWLLFLKENATPIEVVITPSEELFINSKKINGTVIRSSHDSFQFQDHFGYLLKLFSIPEGTYTFYDEADDSTYQAVKKQ